MRKIFFLLIAISFFAKSYSQQQFEDPKLNNTSDSVKVKVGADFAIQWQSLNHSADSSLIKLGEGINLPTANLNIDALLAPGIKVNLQTYLAARHHNDAWVKGGYLLIDKLPFFNSQLIDKIMTNVTIKIGETDLNYGDAHYRRSDNGRVINNPFVGNYILDAWTTAPMAEVMFRKSGWLAMGAVTTGIVNQQIAGYTGGKYVAYNQYDELAYYGKVGFDKNVSNDWRLRLTVSGYHASNSHGGTLYSGDRAGSRYYLVMNRAVGGASAVDITVGPTTGNWSLGGSSDRQNSIMTNLYTKAYGFEFFGTFEKTSGSLVNATHSPFDVTQLAGEALYYFGSKEQFYGGARYNTVKDNTGTDKSINRYQVALGWKLTPNIGAKVEYVNQKYNNFIAQYGANAGFKGIMVEAGISF